MPLGPHQFSLRKLLLWGAGLCVVLAIIAWFFRAVRDSRNHATETSAQGPLNQLTLALHNYHDTYGSFPPAYISDAQGQPLHSWRVLILPFIEEQSVYAQYDFAEPWNGPSNRQLASRIPRMYHHYGDSRGTIFTSYAVVVGKETPFPGAKTTTLSDIKDGVDNTILLVEIANSDICWMEPRDLELDTMSWRIDDTLRPSISTGRTTGPFATFADGIRAYHVQPNISPDDLRALFTIDGGKKNTRAMLVKQGALR